MGRGRGRVAFDHAVRRFMLRLAGTQVATGIGTKLFDAMPATEMISPAIVVDRARGGRWHNVHATDRVLDRGTGVVAWRLVNDGQSQLVRVHEFRPNTVEKPFSSVLSG